MTAYLAVFHLSFRASFRSHPMRAVTVLLSLSSLLAPSLVAFAFSGSDALAVSGALGSAALLAPAVALLGGILIAAGDRGADGISPLLRGSCGPAGILASAACGAAAAGALVSVLASAAAALALVAGNRPFHPRDFALAELTACAAGPAAAAMGLLLAIAAPAPLAAALAALMAGALLLLPGASPTAGFLLARDAAFGTVPAQAAAFSCAASLAFAAAAVAAGTLLLRAKDLAPRAGDE